ncbi:ABC transporter substrate-binding protein [Paracoccus xiamenensis]|uniref:ABC transporter substrate-binding protein n=1 Tax=Paracoccus xiamenensis TaxID=2714901 RepID=UPI0014096F21|nr:ABC transporter substrate-binding protein [Paracoccus xiamenensis]NHF74431.1 ABC transporter substrate-binding protein [Paracoccus xiamenensis]
MIGRALAGMVLALCLTGGATAQPVIEASESFGDPQAAAVMLVRATTDIDLFDEVLDGFVTANPDIRIDYEQWGSNDLFKQSQQDCLSGRFSADMVISSAVDQQVKLVNDGCARPYRSAQTASLPDEFQWRSELFGITREPAVMVYNRELVPEAEAPRTRFDLVDLLRPEDSRFAGMVATYDIEESGLGYLFAFVDAQQATSFGSLAEAFAQSGAVSTCCSTEIIDGVASGRYLLAYNVLGSYALAQAERSPNLAIVVPQDYALILSRGALIPRRARNPAAAGRFLDYLLSPAGRAIMARSHLYVDVTDGDASGLDVPAANDSILRPIPLSPVLLVGLDKEKRAHFLSFWRDTFAGATSSD